MLSRNGNIFTALKTGTVRVTYTVEGQSTYYDITAQAAQLPKTGQDGTLIWLLAAAGAAALAAAVLAVKYKRAK
jgi:LPXTG-motif cell wall-anchored protein